MRNIDEIMAKSEKHLKKLQSYFEKIEKLNNNSKKEDHVLNGNLDTIENFIKEFEKIFEVTDKFNKAEHPFKNSEPSEEFDEEEEKEEEKDEESDEESDDENCIDLPLHIKRLAWGCARFKMSRNDVFEKYSLVKDKKTDFVQCVDELKKMIEVDEYKSYDYQLVDIYNELCNMNKIDYSKKYKPNKPKKNHEKSRKMYDNL